MKTNLALVSSAAFAALAFMACAHGQEGEPITDELPVNGATPDAAPGSSARLPPRANDGADAGEPDAAGSQDAASDDASSTDASVDAKTTVDAATGACAAGSTQLGEYATWYGKVNVHRATGGTWLVDTDCSSGADINTVAYCTKFWPASVTQVQLASVTPDAKPFTSGGGSAPACGGIALSAGQMQFACCAP